MRYCILLIGLAFAAAAAPCALAAGFQTVPLSSWDRAAVERVLHAFAYGGRVSEAQIQTWVLKGPSVSITQILTLQPSNPYLSPPIDNINQSVNSLIQLQSLLESDSSANPMCPFKRSQFNTYDISNGEAYYSRYGIQRSWLAAAHLRGSNPFRHKVGLWLTNYLMATSYTRTRINLIRDHYDSAMDLLTAGQSLWKALAAGASSAAIAMEYGHQKATFDNTTTKFTGSDDFAREYHQLFFKIDGTTDGAEYHETVTIPNMARLLTGMTIDQQPGPTGIPLASNNLWVSPIGFTDHVDGIGTQIENQTFHHQAPLEILKTTIDGINAKDKILELSSVAIIHPDSLNNLPVEIVRFFGDEDITPDEIIVIRDAWRNVAGRGNDLLNFLRAYATSTTFHSASTYKYMTAFDQSIIPWNISNVSNAEFYASAWTPVFDLESKSIQTFLPLYRIFGHQTGLNAANDSNMFRIAYNFSAIDKGYFANPIYCKDLNGNTLYSWTRDWRAMIPASADRKYPVGDVARWLWRRLTGDSGANLTKLERAYLAAILARRIDLATLINPSQPNAVYTAADLEQEPLASLVNQLEATNLPLNSGNSVTRSDANFNVAMAVNFIRATPFAFAMEGR